MLITSFFGTICFLKWCPIFDGSALCFHKVHSRKISFLYVFFKNLVKLECPGSRTWHFHKIFFSIEAVFEGHVRTMWQIDYHAEPIQLFYHSLQSKKNTISVTPNICHSNRFHIHNPKGKKIGHQRPPYLNYATDWSSCRANSVLKSK